MKKFIILVLGACMALALFASCSTNGDDDGDINGKWTLSTVAGAPASLLGYSGTMTVTDSSSFTLAMVTSLGTNNDNGTVTAKSDKVYTFTDSSGNVIDYTLDGDSLTGTEPVMGVTYGYVK